MSNQVSDSGLGEPPQAPVYFSTMYELLKMELLQFYMVYFTMIQIKVFSVPSS
jgi:hypothetical protein